MFSLMTKEPVKGFRSVSLQQVINADREMWMQAAQNARGKMLSDPSRPLDEILEKAFSSPETSYHLLPLPAAGKGHGKTKQGTEVPKKPPLKRPFSGPKGGSAAKKGKGKGLDLPPGCSPETGSGQRICFQYNRKRCHQDKDRCGRGLHVCWLKTCGGKHAHGDCPNGP